MQLILGCLILVIGAVYEAHSAGTSCNCGWVNKGRIIGGKVAVKHKYPMIVALEKYRVGTLFCGGAILTPWHIITAAHCTYEKEPWQIRVRVGAHDLTNSGKVYELAKIVQHEKYDDDLLIYDMALLVTASKIFFNQLVGPVCLPKGKLSLAGEKLTALGWGLTIEDGLPSLDLREVQLKAISFSDCLRMWTKDDEKPRAEMHLCSYTSGKDTCQGDSGGPLIWLDNSTNRYTLTSVISYGNGCGGSFPGVNTDVTLFLDWINSKIAATKPGITACRKL